ncbi:hypothetical protein DPM19_11885 [Actinomadura craniellae]|uniref:Uncharacterized protein n=1 Tax=Actinomadura craniellae TaxID=2231787 RepID=A0A365H8D9_9ACTN|nr:hypothetical protein [Actinomadura craniellae]RAY15390.1 hypothetical protein DPM19_11885 [Actinomadura craniellae]
MTDDDPIPDRLRAEAERHAPDRDRMWGRVEAAMADSARSAEIRRWGAPLIAAAVLAALALTGWNLVGPRMGERPAQPIAGANSVTPGSPTGTPSPDPSSTPAHEVLRPKASPTAKRRAPRPPSGPLITVRGTGGAHGGRFWGSQCNVVVTARRPVTALTVTIRVSGSRAAGAWTSAPQQDFDVDVRESRGELIYRFVLERGRTLQPGTHTFTAHYLQDRGRDRDGRRAASFSVVARSGSGPATTVRGRF